jgi:hypothetical protein
MLKRDVILSLLNGKWMDIILGDESSKANVSNKEIVTYGSVSIS